MVKETVLVTGAASRKGIGYHIVDRLSQNPKYDPIIATDKDPAIHERFRNGYQSVRTLVLDVRNPNDITFVSQYILSETGSVDLLINNAGISGSGKIESYFDNEGNPTVELRDLWETNLRGPLLLMNAVLTNMRQQEHGTVINITSSSPYHRSPFKKAYADYKAVLAGATQTVAIREEPHGIHVVNLQPGTFLTGIEEKDKHELWTKESDELDVMAAQDFYDWWRRRFGGNPKDVAEVVYRIAEGEIKDHKVFIGFPARLVTFLYEHVNHWDDMFNLGYNILYQPIKLGMAIRREHT